MHLGTFLIVSTIGRIPGTYLLTVQGAAVRSQAYAEAILITFICAALAFITYLYRAHILRWLKTRACFLFTVGIGVVGYTLANGQVVASFFYDQKGNVVRQERDTNGDGRMNLWIYYENNQPVRREEDRNHDGRIGRIAHFHSGKIAKVEES